MQQEGLLSISFVFPDLTLGGLIRLLVENDILLVKVDP